MQHQISNHTFTIFEHFQYENRTEKEGQFFLRRRSQEKKIFFLYKYIYMKHIYFKLTVKYMSIYT